MRLDTPEPWTSWVLIEMKERTERKAPFVEDVASLLDSWGDIRSSRSVA